MLARVFLLIALGAWAVLALSLVGGAFPQLIVVALFAIRYGWRPWRRLSGWAFGTARWGTTGELAKAGMIGDGDVDR